MFHLKWFNVLDTTNEALAFGLAAIEFWISIGCDKESFWILLGICVILLTLMQHSFSRYIDAYDLHFDVDFSTSGEVLGKLVLPASVIVAWLDLTW